MRVQSAIFTVMLTAACTRVPAPTPAQPQQVAEQTEATPQPKQTPTPTPAPEIPHFPTTSDLDAKNGFRDLTFGQQAASVIGLQLEPDSGSFRKATRRSDDLSLDGVPLKSLSYSFYKDRLYRIEMKFEIEHQREGQFFTNHYHRLTRNSNSRGLPIGKNEDVPTRLQEFVRDLYGSPSISMSEPITTEHSSRWYTIGEKRRFTWRGRKAELVIDEQNNFQFYTIPPRTMGSITLTSIPLAAEHDADITRLRSNQAQSTKDGL